jgi:hypothetical protein
MMDSLSIMRRPDRVGKRSCSEDFGVAGTCLILVKR